MTTQPELFPAKAPAVDVEDVEFLCAVLHGAGWQTADAIACRPAWQSFFHRGGADRRIRSIGSACKGRILSYPGSPGYRLTSEATIEEIQTATNKLRHQANEMTRRAMEVDRVYHKKI